MELHNTKSLFHSPSPVSLARNLHFLISWLAQIKSSISPTGRHKFPHCCWGCFAFSAPKISANVWLNQPTNIVDSLKPETFYKVHDGEQCSGGIPLARTWMSASYNIGVDVLDRFHFHKMVYKYCRHRKWAKFHLYCLLKCRWIKRRKYKCCGCNANLMPYTHMLWRFTRYLPTFFFLFVFPNAFFLSHLNKFELINLHELIN